MSVTHIKNKWNLANLFITLLAFVTAQLKVEATVSTLYIRSTLHSVLLQQSRIALETSICRLSMPP